MDKKKDSDLAGETDDELVNLAIEAGPGGFGLLTGAQVEMSRRLRQSLADFHRASDRWSRRLALLTGALIVLTVVLVGIGVETAYLTWVLLERQR